ncbi:MAG: helix-turn-helix domain-containing protein [Proteobacteria bacterium]|nr:helix-turn-helix domain-containing protein [Pseudomonadota bacterium]
MTEPKLLTPAQVAEALQLNESTITRWLRKGRLRGFKVGKDWRVSTVDLNAFLEEQANIPPSDRRTGQSDFTG